MKSNNKKYSIGSWITLDNIAIVEIMAQSGFDWLCIDLEHTVIDYKELQNLIAISSYNNIEVFVRVGGNDEIIIKRVLDAGANGIIVPLIKNAEDVKKSIQFSLYPPLGIRGVNSLSRAQGYGFDFDSYIKRWNNDSIFMIQIESIEGVKNIESILSYDEIDGVMIGPYDISGSLGVPGQLDHPDVIDASKKVIEACKKFNKSCGTQLNDPNLNNINSLFELGYTFAILGSDLFILWKWAEAMKNIIEDFKKT